jgi:hypothetical protein
MGNFVALVVVVEGYTKLRERATDSVGPHSQVDLGHNPIVFREQISGLYDLLR